MKALSVRQPWASAIAAGTKTIEYRRWQTAYRGPLLIVSSKRPAIDGLPGGVALAVVQLVDCQPHGDVWGWVFQTVRPLKKPFAVRGQLRLFDVTMPRK